MKSETLAMGLTPREYWTVCLRRGPDHHFATALAAIAFAIANGWPGPFGPVVSHHEEVLPEAP